jgi:glycosyltransferase involved in cell wall biosynthesis
MAKQRHEAVAPVVSVIIPCFNAAEFITETVRSVLEQSQSDLELIVVDDGSTDGSAGLVGAIGDPRLRLIRKVNAGVAAARNDALSLARGEFVAFLDADDLYLPGNLERKVEFLRRDPRFELVYSAESLFDSRSGSVLGRTRGRAGEALDDLLEFRGNLIHSPSSVLARRRVLDEAGPFDPDLSTSADWELWTRIARITPFGYLDEPLVRYRVHPGQMHRNIPLMERDMLHAFTKCRAAGMFRDERHFAYCSAKLHLILAACYLVDQRDPRRSAIMLSRSLRRSPLPLLERLGERVGRIGRRPRPRPGTAAPSDSPPCGLPATKADPGELPAQVHLLEPVKRPGAEHAD